MPRSISPHAQPPHGAERRASFNLAHFGEAVGHPSRAAMLVALIGGTARPASELARIAGVVPSTATTHLQCLEGAGLVAVRPQGRHRYYALANERVAELVERLGASSETKRRTAPDDDPFNAARTCWGHLAGRLAIAFWDRAREAKWVRWNETNVTLLPRGERVFADQGLPSTAGEGRACLDWSERVPHVAGPLGVGVCRALFDQGWVARAGDRVLRVTTRGARAFRAMGVT